MTAKQILGEYIFAKQYILNYTINIVHLVLLEILNNTN